LKRYILEREKEEEKDDKSGSIKSTSKTKNPKKIFPILF
jgi:hypothetical protein